MEIQTKLLKSIFIISLLALASCGAKKQDGSLDSSSRIASTASSTTTTSTTTTSTSTSNKTIATCNTASSSNLSVGLGAYQVGSQINPTYMNAKFSALPALENDYSYVRFFRWQANTTSIYTDNTPLKVKLVSYPAGDLILDYKDYIRWAEVKAYAEKLGYTTATELFAHVRVIIDLKDPSAQFDGLSIGYYDQSGNLSEFVKMILPTFYANPNYYAIDSDGTTRNPNVQALHPFKSVIGTSWENDESHYKILADKLCETWNY